MDRKEFRLGGSGRPYGSVSPVVPIRVEDLTAQEIEDAILQVLALGRVASVDEATLAETLDAVMADPTVTEWAQSFTAAFGIQWERRRLFQDLLFFLGSAGKAVER